MKKVKLGDIAKITSGGTPSRAVPAYWNGNIPWVKTAQIQNCVINESDVDEFITDKGLKNSSAKMVPKGTLLMAMYGQGKTRGQVAKLNFNATINQACAAIELKKDVVSDYVYQYLLSEYEQIRNMSNTGGQENLSSGIIKQIVIPLPTQVEQLNIVEILNLWDKAIEKTERLIQAKEKQFKWLVNELINKQAQKLNWPKVALGKVANVKKGKQLNVEHMIPDGEFYVLNGGMNPSGLTNNWNVRKDTISISEGGNSCGFVNYNTENFWAGGHCYTLEIQNKNVNNLFLYFQLKALEPNLMMLRVGSGLPNIQKKDIDSFIVSVPETTIQFEIANEIEYHRKEIDVLNKILKKYNLQKKGLMKILFR